MDTVSVCFFICPFRHFAVISPRRSLRPRVAPDVFAASLDHFSHAFLVESTMRVSSAVEDAIAGKSAEPNPL
jgi:hypothetical protein